MDHGLDGEAAGEGPLRVRDGDDRGVPADGAVDGAQLGVEKVVDRRHHRPVGVRRPDERAGDRVVVHHVAVAERVVGGEDLGHLGHRLVHQEGVGPGAREPPVHGTRRVTGGEERDLVTRLPEAPGQAVDDRLGASVRARGDRQPRRSDQPDAHVPAPDPLP